MNRRNFIKGLGLVGGVAVAPVAVAATTAGLAIVKENSVSLTKGHPTYTFPIAFENGSMMFHAARFQRRGNSPYYDLMWTEVPNF